MTDEGYVKRLEQHYVPLLGEHGATHRALDWGSASSQRRRFEILLEIGDVGTASILDVGCGLGHLVDVLAERGARGAYTGIDPVSEMIAGARARHPDRTFEVGMLGEGEPHFRADYVLESGIFTFADRTVLESTVAAMYRACRIGVAFNVLSDWGSEKEPHEFTPDPLQTLLFCRSLTPWVVLRHDYLPHDFTVYLYREQRP